MSFVKRFQDSLESLHSLPEDACYVVAYSGGVDSHVLLYCCKQLNLPVRAVHVHHGLQRVADDWVNHCQAICNVLDTRLDVLYVDAQAVLGQSPEEAARSVRYKALQDNLIDNDCLITAQHLNDQAETLLLQLFRTASTAGLAAMPASRQFGDHFHLRPLLSFSREDIESFAKANDLHWIEDPSNDDVQFDRNFIRKDLLPMLEERWPEIIGQLSTVASLQSKNLRVLEDMAAIDLANAITLSVFQSRTRVYDELSVLSIPALKELSSARLLNVLRYWILKITKEHAAKTSPTRNLLEEIEKTLINSQADANPVIVFAGFEFRKYQDDLYLLKQAVDKNLKEELIKDVDWNTSLPLTLSSLNIRLKALKTAGKGLKQSLLEEPLKICFRKGGEKFHPVERKHSQSLKKLLQEANVPPWQRDVIPLLYFEDELIAVVGLWVSKKYAVNENAWVVDIEKW